MCSSATDVNVFQCHRCQCVPVPQMSMCSSATDVNVFQCHRCQCVPVPQMSMCSSATDVNATEISCVPVPQNVHANHSPGSPGLHKYTLFQAIPVCHLLEVHTQCKHRLNTRIHDNHGSSKFTLIITCGGNSIQNSKGHKCLVSITGTTYSAESS